MSYLWMNTINTTIEIILVTDELPQNEYSHWTTNIELPPPVIKVPTSGWWEDQIQLELFPLLGEHFFVHTEHLFVLLEQLYGL